MGYTKVGPLPIVNFTSEYVKPLVSLKTYIKAQGGGTPTTPIPIVGVSEVNVTRAGKNLVSGILTGQAIGSAGNIFADESYNIAYAPIKKGADYIITSDNGVWAYFTSIPENGSVSYDGLRTIDANRKFTAPINGYVAFRSSSSYTTPQIEAGSTPSSYESHITPTIFTLNLGQTIYGGYVDWKNGKLAVTHNSFILTEKTAYQTSGGHNYVSYYISDMLYANVRIGDILSEVVTFNGGVGDYFTIFRSTNSVLVGVPDNYPLTDFNNEIADTKIVYPLATPIEIDLPTTMPSTIEGVQNWFADSGDIELCYTSFIEYHKVASIFVTENSNVQVQSTSGSIANFTTSLALPLVALKTNIVEQGGGGTPQSAVPITGFDSVNLTRAGKNLVLGVIEGGSIGSNGTIAGGSQTYSMAYAPVKKGQTYTMTTNETTNQFVGGYFTSLPQVGSTSYDGQRIVVYNNFTITAPIDGYVIFRIMAGYEYSQLEVGSQATAYVAPLTPTTFTIQLGQTIYGGYVDWGNGKLVITHLHVKMADLTWIGSNGVFENRTGFEDLHTAVRGSYTYCDIYISSGSTSSANMQDKTIQTMGGAGSSNFWVKDLDYSTAEDFIDSLANHEIVYQLATPIEIDLPTTMPSTIEGEQNWFADSGDIELEYKKIIT